MTSLEIDEAVEAMKTARHYGRKHIIHPLRNYDLRIRDTKEVANYELTETPDIHEHDVFCDCKPEEYEVNYPYLN